MVQTTWAYATLWLSPTFSQLILACNQKDFTNIRLCLLEYDGPYYFDRIKHRIKQINPKNVEKPILEQTEIFKEFEKDESLKNASFEEKFDAITKDYGTYINSFFD